MIMIAIVVGVAGYVVLEGFSIGDAFFMTIITLSTVGYGEVHPLDASGRIFTSILIIFILLIFNI